MSNEERKKITDKFTKDREHKEQISYIKKYNTKKDAKEIIKALKERWKNE